MMNLLINNMEHIFKTEDNITIMQTIIRNLIDFIITDMSFKQCITNYLRNFFSLDNIKKFRELFSYLEGYYSIINIVPKDVALKDGTSSVCLSGYIEKQIFKNISKCSDINPFTYENSVLLSSGYEYNILFEMVNESMDMFYNDNKK